MCIGKGAYPRSYVEPGPSRLPAWLRQQLKQTLSLMMWGDTSRSQSPERIRQGRQLKGDVVGQEMYSCEGTDLVVDDVGGDE